MDSDSVRIENSISDTEASEKAQVLAHMSKLISTRCRGAYCSTKEKVRRTDMMCNFCGVCLCEKICFSLYHRNYAYEH